jgi:predicted nucleotidyltransferase component of viral defense system
MKYASAAAFRTALEARLTAMARGENAPTLVQLRKMVVFDRLLARLLIAAPGRWVLKGGVALELRLGDRARTTKDLDLARQDDEEQSTADLFAATEIDLGDFFKFAVERARVLSAEQKQHAIRYRIHAELAGRPFDDITLDIGFADPLPTAPDRLEGSDILGFAGIPRIETPALTLEQHLAEKLHAFTRIYKEGRGSSRPKDLIDIILIRSIATFRAQQLRQAIENTFITRATHDLPAVLPPPPDDWTVSYHALASALGLDPDIAIGHRLAAEFLDPILSRAANGDERWDSSAGAWSED